MFDYEKEIEKIIKGINVVNLNGRFQVKKILEYLKVCPFMDIVSVYMNIKAKDAYGKLKYHLDENVYKDLLIDLKSRKEQIKENYKKQLELVDNNDEQNNDEDI